MNAAPRLEIRLDRIEHNARVLVGRLAARGIGVTGVTKVALGAPEVAGALLRAGVRGLGDSRVENLARLGAGASRTLIRSPMCSQAEQVVEHAEVSCNTELDVIAALSAAAVAQGRPHGVLLMVELGDLREGILPRDLESVARRASALPNIVLRGIGTNLACQSGVAPGEANMAELSALADGIEAALGASLELVSGGNSANLDWAFATPDVGRVNDLRLGEAIMLGREPMHRRPIEGLHLDAFTLVGEVIESKDKPSLPWGEINQTAFGAATPAKDRGTRGRALVALGRQDADPDGLLAPQGIEIVGASSDHLVLDTGNSRPAVGSELRFGVNYSALLVAMTSPFVTLTYA